MAGCIVEANIIKTVSCPATWLLVLSCCLPFVMVKKQGLVAICGLSFGIYEHSCMVFILLWWHAFSSIECLHSWLERMWYSFLVSINWILISSCNCLKVQTANMGLVSYKSKHFVHQCGWFWIPIVSIGAGWSLIPVCWVQTFGWRLFISSYICCLLEVGCMQDEV